MARVTVFAYKPGTALLYRLDPRFKLLFMVMLSLATIDAGYWALSIVTLLLLSRLTFGTEKPLCHILRRLAISVTRASRAATLVHVFLARLRTTECGLQIAGRTLRLIVTDIEPPPRVRRSGSPLRARAIRVRFLVCFEILTNAIARRRCSAMNYALPAPKSRCSIAAARSGNCALAARPRRTSTRRYRRVSVPARTEPLFDFPRCTFKVGEGVGWREIGEGEESARECRAHLGAVVVGSVERNPMAARIDAPPSFAKGLGRVLSKLGFSGQDTENHKHRCRFRSRTWWPESIRCAGFNRSCSR